MESNKSEINLVMMSGYVAGKPDYSKSPDNKTILRFIIASPKLRKTNTGGFTTVKQYYTVMAYDKIADMCKEQKLAMEARAMEQKLKMQQMEAVLKAQHSQADLRAKSMQSAQQMQQKASTHQLGMVTQAQKHQQAKMAKRMKRTSNQQPLRKGEVRRYNPETGKYESNLD